MVNCADYVKLEASSSEVFVGRQYAGMLGSIALVTSVLRGLVHGTPAVRVLTMAAVSLVMCSVVGYVVGELAGWIVLTSVPRIAAELERTTARSRHLSARADQEQNRYAAHGHGCLGTAWGKMELEHGQRHP